MPVISNVPDGVWAEHENVPFTPVMRPRCSGVPEYMQVSFSTVEVIVNDEESCRMRIVAGWLDSGSLPVPQPRAERKPTYSPLALVAFIVRRCTRFFTRTPSTV